jgi:ATP-dependent Clp protease adaptor protein ClpS
VWLGLGRATSVLTPGRSGANRTTGLALWKACSVADTLERTDEDTDLRVVVEPDRPWITLVWNDPVNEMTYVAWVFKSYFGFSPAEARKRMLQVHNDGKAVVASGSREEMERHVNAMHGYGLWATLQKDDE